ncbi:MAG: phosphoribosylformylglycinamidine cyclo-ligase, partial [Muribaculaceae bacterium]|nr:phosphoribosylformylglycinamidine cyclo-ligase [Muribaculaceae bacterium]
VEAGDLLIGIASSGVHSNGFSLVRKVISDAELEYDQKYPETGEQTLGEMLLTPTKIYVKQVLAVLKEVDVHGVAHITGGGFDENIPRILKEGQAVEIEEGSWEILPVFRLLEKYGKIPHREMFNIFNMGIGMVLAVKPEDAPRVLEILTEQGEKASVIGKIIDSEKGGVIMK